MKNLFLAAAAAALVCAGCSAEDDSVVPTPPLENPVNFTTEIASVSRSAPNGEADFLDGESFVVSATRALADAAAESWMNSVTLTKTGGKWSALTDYYFMKGYKYAFAAYSPAAAALEMGNTAAVPYTVTNILADQKDLLYATASKDFTKADETSTVALTFEHALSQVKFTAKTAKDYSAYYTVTVKKIELIGINSRGKLNFADGSWTLDAPAVPLSYSVEYDQVLTATETEVATAAKDVLMLLPQDPAGADKLVVTFDVAAVSGKGDATLAGAGKTISLTLPSKTWVSGFIYTYQITLNLDETFGWTVPELSDPTISPWMKGDDIPVGNK